MLKAKTSKVSMQDTIFLLSNTPISEIEKIKYVAKVGLNMYAMVETPVDIAFTISMISQFAKNSSSKHFNAINQILQYLAKSAKRAITFKEDEKLKLNNYWDSDWARDYIDQKSTSRFIFILNEGLISYISKKQVIVALSSTETEYMVFSLTA